LKNEAKNNYTEEKNGGKYREESTFYPCQSAFEKKKDVWYIDSWCSNHMIRDESVFYKLDMIITIQITMGNDTIVQG
jgi:hypothetical protein